MFTSLNKLGNFVSGMLIAFLIAFIITLIIPNKTLVVNKVITDTITNTTTETILLPVPTPLPTEYAKDVRATYYYPNDSTSSTTCTASGKCTKDFSINDKGWYTYQGRVVVATAMTYCLDKTTGICGKWNTAYTNTQYFSMYDHLSITVDGITYPAIALDLCGTAMNGDNKVDIFVSAHDYGYDGPMTITWKGGE